MKLKNKIIVLVIALMLCLTIFVLYLELVYNKPVDTKEYPKILPLSYVIENSEIQQFDIDDYRVDDSLFVQDISSPFERIDGGPWYKSSTFSFTIFYKDASHKILYNYDTHEIEVD